MGRRRTPHATEAELEILQVLWEHGPQTVRDVHRLLGVSRKTGYTTTLKLLQIMTDKQLVVRDESSRAHVYSAAATENEVQEEIVGHMLDRVFAGSASKLMLRALSAKPASKKELAEIRKLLARLPRGTDDRD